MSHISLSLIQLCKVHTCYNLWSIHLFKISFKCTMAYSHRWVQRSIFPSGCGEQMLHSGRSVLPYPPPCWIWVGSSSGCHPCWLWFSLHCPSAPPVPHRHAPLWCWPTQNHVSQMGSIPAFWMTNLPGRQGC